MKIIFSRIRRRVAYLCFIESKKACIHHLLILGPYMNRLKAFSKLLPITLVQRPRLHVHQPCSLRSWSFLATTKPQSWYSSLKCLNTSLIDGVIPSKEHVLWCFQINHFVKMISEFAPFLHSLTLWIVLAHQFVNKCSLLWVKWRHLTRYHSEIDMFIKLLVNIFTYA
jgi:hypothetical protein